MLGQLNRWKTGIRQLFFATALFLVVLVVLVASAASAQSLPKAVGRVNDFGNVIDPAVEAEIDHQIDELEQKTSSEIAVVTIQSLGSISVEEYASRLFHEWGIGQAKQDNGVLILVAVDDHKMRIEVGYGLEGVLPDILAGQIIRDEFTPRFREDDYSGGIRNGVNRVVELVEKHEVLTPEELARLNERGGIAFPVWLQIPFFGLFVLLGFALVGIGVRTQAGVLMVLGSLFGGLPLLMAFISMGGLALTLLPVAGGMGWLGYRLGDRESWRNRFRITGGGSGSSSGWTSSGSTGSDSGSSSSSSYDSSSGSDSSFGGGDSGGGGASGSW